MDDLAFLDPEAHLAEIAGALEAGTEPPTARLESLGRSLPITEVASDAAVRAIVTALQSAAFLALPRSWLLADFVRMHWEWVPRSARDDLRQALAAAFDRYADWMGAFVSAEILGERCCDRWALDRLVALGASARMPARALVPHGLEYLARATRDPVLRASAVRALEKLAGVPEPRVREEAASSLSKIDRPL